MNTSASVAQGCNLTGCCINNLNLSYAMLIYKSKMEIKPKRVGTLFKMLIKTEWHDLLIIFID